MANPLRWLHEKQGGMIWIEACFLALFLVMLSILIYGLVSDTTPPAERKEVVFSDPNLEAAVREAIDKPEGPIYINYPKNKTTNIERLTELVADGRGIYNLRGLDKCEYLTSVDLSDNQISDISTLSKSDLTVLTTLDLSNNQISDIPSLSSLTSLSSLDLRGNPLDLWEGTSSLSGVKMISVDLRSIETLEERGVTVEHDAIGEPAAVSFPDTNLEAAIREAVNKATGTLYIIDVEPLTELLAAGEGISDLTGLEYCTDLTTLDLSDNGISDISQLASLNRLSSLDLSNNALDLSEGSEALGIIGDLEDKGVAVIY